MPDLLNSGLTKIYESVSPKMTIADDALRATLGALNDGGEITTAQLLKLQYEISRYTVTASVFSNVIKEMGDSLKQMASKIG